MGSRFEENADALVAQDRNEVLELRAMVATLEAKVVQLQADKLTARAEVQVCQAERHRHFRLRNEIVIALGMQQERDPHNTLQKAAAKINQLLAAHTEADMQRWANGQVPVEPAEWCCAEDTYKTLDEIVESGQPWLDPISVQPIWYGRYMTLVIVPIKGADEADTDCEFKLFGSEEEAEAFVAGLPEEVVKCAADLQGAM